MCVKYMSSVNISKMTVLKHSERKIGRGTCLKQQEGEQKPNKTPKKTTTKKQQQQQQTS